MPSPVEDAFAGRVAPGLAVADSAARIARACHAMAGRFHRGGTLIAFGSGGSATDAAHLAVEFVHPVLVGRRALPAVSLANDPAALSGIAHTDGPSQTFAAQLRLLGQPEDIAVAIAAGECDDAVRAGLATARRIGMLTVVLAGAAEPADHVLLAATGDPRVAKEVHVTTYHILWELVHVFLDQPALLGQEVPG